MVMRLLEKFDDTILLDALVEYTARHSKLLAEGGKERDIINCRQTIETLLKELEIRKEAKEREHREERSEGRP